MPRIENDIVQKVSYAPRQMVLLTMWSLGRMAVGDWERRLALVLFCRVW